MQRGLDYACAAGADCSPIQENGLCYLPNTLQAHASYAFNSFFQRSFMAPSSCDFSHTATLAKTDPSYGSCVYPASPSTAGGITSSGSGATPTTNPNGFGSGSGSASPMTPATSTSTSPTTIYGGAGTGGVFNPNNNMGPPIPTTTNSKAPSSSMPLSTATTLLILLLLVYYMGLEHVSLFTPFTC